MITYVTGGRLGDFIHTLWVVKQKWLETNEKGCVLLSQGFGSDRFARGVDATFEELYPIVSKQPYIETFKLFKEKSLPEGCVNLNSWRRCRLIHRHNWDTVFSDTYKINKTDNDKGWIEYETDNKWKDTVVIHQSLERIDPNFEWESILKNNKCTFVTCNLTEYETFKYKNIVDVYVAKDLSEIVTIIGSCKTFCGNHSGPLAIAVALGKNAYLQFQIDCINKSYVNMRSNIFYKNKPPPPDILKLHSEF